MSLLEGPMHPGEVLKELYLSHLEIRAIAFAQRLGAPRAIIIKGTTRITPDTALAAKEIDVSDIEPLVTA